MPAPSKSPKNSGSFEFKVHDLALAEWGRKEIMLAEQEMPGLMAVREEYAASQPLKGLRIMGSLHMTIQTAVLIETLSALGATVRWCSCNIFSTQDHAAAAVAVGPKGTRHNPPGHAGLCLEGRRRSKNIGGAPSGPWISATAAARTKSSMTAATPRCSSTRALNTKTPAKSPRPIPPTTRNSRKCSNSWPSASRQDPQRWHKVAEEMQGVSAKKPPPAFIASTRCRRPARCSSPPSTSTTRVTKSKFDNLYGCRHSLVDGLMRATDVMLSGKVAVVCGYGDVGKGCCQSLRGQGARVIVTEIDPICALQAAMEGFQVLTVEGRARHTPTSSSPPPAITTSSPPSTWPK